ncbi:MAG: hypothetical protein AAFV31_14765 [Pseudomonadota bacterium]
MVGRGQNEWTDWKEFSDSPYINWDGELRGLTTLIRDAGDDLVRFSIPDLAATSSDAKETPSDQSNGAAAKDSDLILEQIWELVDKLPSVADPEKAVELDRIYTLIMKHVLANLRDSIGQIPPLPKDAAYTGGADALLNYFDYVEKKGTIPDALACGDLNDAFTLDSNGVVIGVIDLGVTLGQHRTRLPYLECSEMAQHGKRLPAPGKTRIISGWQQSAPRDGTGKTPQAFLPFGEELLATDINDAISAATTVSHFDEEAFNRATAVEDYRRPLGQRELGLRAAHGTHILDCAAGYDAQVDENKAPATNRRIIAVNLPARELVGHAAQNLEFFAIFGLLRIATLSDALWVANKKRTERAGKPFEREDRKEDGDGYHVVVNLSFGKQASQRDGSDLLAMVMRNLNYVRSEAGFQPIHLSMPAGNENLERGNARTQLQTGADTTLYWRVLPEDQSANFLEIWADYPDAGEIAGAAPLQIEIVTPTNDELSLTGETTRMERTLKDANGGTLARLFAMGVTSSRDIDDPPEARPAPPQQSEATSDESAAASAPRRPKIERKRVGYILATRWTQDYSSEAVRAPAGIWAIRIKNRTGTNMLIVANTQTDQSEKPNSATNQRSYFDHSDYVRFDQGGRELDTYSYPQDGSPPEPQDSSNVIRRHGTLNAIGKEAWTIMAAGHRHSDGRMENYSSTGVKRPGAQTGEGVIVPGMPTASMPSRDAAGHFGRLAAGGRDGAAAAIQGTSVAAAMMTRRFVELLVEGAGFVPSDAIVKFQAKAKTEEDSGEYPGPVVDVKAGHGRLNQPQSDEELGRFMRGIKERRKPD